MQSNTKSITKPGGTFGSRKGSQQVQSANGGENLGRNEGSATKEKEMSFGALYGGIYQDN